MFSSKTVKPQSFHTPATLACCHLVIMTKLQNASFKCETGQQSVTMNGLFKHRLHTSGSALTTETCVELKLHMRGVYRTGNHLSDHPRLKLKDCFKKNHKVCCFHLQSEHKGLTKKCCCLAFKMKALFAALHICTSCLHD